FTAHPPELFGLLVDAGETQFLVEEIEGVADTLHDLARPESRLYRLMPVADDDEVELLKRGEGKRVGRAVGLCHLVAVARQQRRQQLPVVLSYVQHSLLLPIIRHWISLLTVSYCDAEALGGRRRRVLLLIESVTIIRI